MGGVDYQKEVTALKEKIQRKVEVLSEVTEEIVRLKKRTWGDLNLTWVAHDTRDLVVDFIRYWSTLTELAVGCFVRWIGISCANICVGTLVMG